MLIKTKSKSALKMLITLLLTIALTMGIYLAIPKQTPKVSAATTGSSAVLKGTTTSSSTYYPWYNKLNFSSYDVVTIRITTDASKITGFEQGENVADASSENALYCYYKLADYQVDNDDVYDVVLYADVETIYAPENSYALFYHLINCKSIIFDNFNTSKATDMHEIFKWCYALENLDLSGFDTSNVTNMSEMFSGCSSLTSLNLNNFNTSKVTDMSAMFGTRDFYFGQGWHPLALTSLDLSNFDTRNVTDMGNMFQCCYYLTSLNLSSFDTSNVTNMGAMFFECFSLTSLNLNNFNTSKVADMNKMFCGCNSLNNLDIRHFSLASITESDKVVGMFGGGDATAESVAGLYGLEDVDTFVNASFEERVQIIATKDGYDTEEIDFEHIKVWVGMAENVPLFIAPNNLNGFSIELGYNYTYSGGGEKTTNVVIAGATHTITKTLFSNWLAKVTSVSPSEISSIKFTSNSSAISGYTKGESVARGLSYYYKLNSDNLYDIVVYSENTIYAPADCTLLFAKSNGDDSFEFLTNCTSIVLDNFNTSNVTNMMGMFFGCTKVNNLDLSNFDTSSVTSMQLMFGGCLDLNTLNISWFSLESITEADGVALMFGQMNWTTFAQAMELTGEELDNFLSLSVDQKIDWLMEMLGDDVSSKDELILMFGAEIGLADISKIIAPTSLNNLTIALPDTYEYKDATGTTQTTSTLVAGATHTIPGYVEDPALSTGIVSDSILLSLLALCFVFSGFMMLKKKKIR